MNSGKGHQEEDDGEGEEFGAKDAATSASNNAKNAKKSDKSNATTRSKHSVTEQRRRSKINESVEYANKLDEEKFTLLDAHISDNNLLIRCSWRRGNAFQILRELIPNSDQKRDTASFLCEVIQYVQFLQEKVTKYEGSYQPWSSEPTKLMPWRNNQWRNLSGQPQTPKNSPGTAFPIRFDERSPVVPASLQPSPHNPIEPDHAKDASCRPIDLQTELPNKNMNIQDGSFSHALHGPPSLDAQSTKCPNSLNIQDDLAIEGGAINISSVYSQGLLNSLAQALESTGVDLSQANIAVQINIGNRAHTKSIAKDHGIFPMPSGDQPVGTFKDTGNDEDLGQSQKRPRNLNLTRRIKQGIIAQSIPEIKHFLRIE